MVLTKAYSEKCDFAYIPALVPCFFFFPCKKSLYCASAWVELTENNSKGKKSLQIHCAFSQALTNGFPKVLCVLFCLWKVVGNTFCTSFTRFCWLHYWKGYGLPSFLLGWNIREQHRSSPFHVVVPQNYVFTLVWKHLLRSSLRLQVLFLCISETENCLGKEEDRKKRGFAAPAWGSRKPSAFDYTHCVGTLLP